MKKRFIDYSINKKMNITLLLFIILPLLLLGGVFSVFVYRSNTAEIRGKTFQNLVNSLEETDLCRETMEQLYLECLSGSALQRVGQNRPIGRDYIDLRQWLDSLYAKGVWYDSICISLKNGQQYQAGNCVDESFEEISEFLEEQQQEYLWVMEDASKYYFLEEEEKPERVLTFYAKIDSLDQELVADTIGVVSARVREDVFERLYSKYFDNRYGTISVINQEGIVLSSTEKETLGEQSVWDAELDVMREQTEGSIWKKGILGMYVYSQSSGDLLIAEIPWQVFYGSSILVLLEIVFSFALCILFVVIFGLLQKKYVVRPLNELADTFGQVEVDNLIQLPETNRQDEVGVLQNSFNDMTGRLDRLINEVYRVEYEKKEAQLQALTEQINPHFLYNTLDSIRWKALRNKDSEVAEQIVTLSDFYRYILNKGNEFLTIEEETAFLKRYLTLMKMRFGDRIVWEFVVDEAALAVKIPKLILQPIVENAVVHGIEPQEQGGRIVIYAEKRDQELFLAVEDTGIGFEQNLNCKNEEVMKLSGAFALKNIYNRLKLFYGNEYEYSIYSEKQRGTRVEIHIRGEIL